MDGDGSGVGALHAEEPTGHRPASQSYSEAMARDEALRTELLAMAAERRGPVRAQRLWDILDDYESWPGRRLVGDDGEHAAWLVAQQEIDDVGLQRRRVVTAPERGAHVR